MLASVPSVLCCSGRAPPPVSPLSLHDALPISEPTRRRARAPVKRCGPAPSDHGSYPSEHDLTVKQGACHGHTPAFASESPLKRAGRRDNRVTAPQSYSQTELGSGRTPAHLRVRRAQRQADQIRDGGAVTAALPELRQGARRGQPLFFARRDDGGREVRAEDEPCPAEHLAGGRRHLLVSELLGVRRELREPTLAAGGQELPEGRGEPRDFGGGACGRGGPEGGQERSEQEPDLRRLGPEEERELGRRGDEHRAEVERELRARLLHLAADEEGGRREE